MVYRETTMSDDEEDKSYTRLKRMVTKTTDSAFSRMKKILWDGISESSIFRSSRVEPEPPSRKIVPSSPSWRGEPPKRTPIRRASEPVKLDFPSKQEYQRLEKTQDNVKPEWIQELKQELIQELRKESEKEREKEKEKEKEKERPSRKVDYRDDDSRSHRRSRSRSRSHSSRSESSTASPYSTLTSSPSHYHYHYRNPHPYLPPMQQMAQMPQMYPQHMYPQHMYPMAYPMPQQMAYPFTPSPHPQLMP